jgi:hypothetical protein
VVRKVTTCWPAQSHSSQLSIQDTLRPSWFSEACEHECSLSCTQCNTFAHGSSAALRNISSPFQSRVTGAVLVTFFEYFMHWLVSLSKRYFRNHNAGDLANIPFSMPLEPSVYTYSRLLVVRVAFFEVSIPSTIAYCCLTFRVWVESTRIMDCTLYTPYCAGP